MTFTRKGKSASMKLRGPKFTIASLLGLTLFIAFALAALTYPSRQQARTRKLYNAQERFVGGVIFDYVETLRDAGCTVTHDGSGMDGLMYWRKWVALLVTSPDGSEDFCYLELEGGVPRAEQGQFDWMRARPIKVSLQGRKLNDELLGNLRKKFEEEGWAYIVNDRCQGNGSYRMKTAAFYLATD